MKKILVGTLTCLFGAIAGHAQQDPVLMRINGQDITRSEFERFCHRNKPSGIAGKETLKRCADLFVDMKLKLSAAQKAGLDTVSDFRTEMENYHRALSRSLLPAKLRLCVFSVIFRRLPYPIICGRHRT